MSIASFFAKAGTTGAGNKRPREEDAAGSSSAPLPLPRTFCAWNANSLLQRVEKDGPALASFLSSTAPDVLVVSEVRMPASGPPGCKKGDGLPRNRGQMARGTAAQGREAEAIAGFLRKHEYRAFYSLSDTKYAGTGLLVRRECAQPSALRYSLDPEAPASQHHDDGRVIVASWEGLEVLATYAPNNGYTEEGFARRRDWDESVGRFFASRPAPSGMVWMGDLNVAAEWHDVGPSPEWFREQNGKDAAHAEDRGQPGFTANEQARFAELTKAAGLRDAYRLLHPHPDFKADCTWRGAPGANGVPEAGRYYGKGMRIDYVLVHESLAPRVSSATVHGKGAERAGFMGSDHCPLTVRID